MTKKTKAEDVLIEWEQDFTKFYTFRFEYIDFDGKRRYELASVNDPMSKAAALTMVNKHIAEFNGKLTDFVECDYFKSVVGQLLLAQHRKSVEKCIDSLKGFNADKHRCLSCDSDEWVPLLQELSNQGEHDTTT